MEPLPHSGQKQSPRGHTILQICKDSNLSPLPISLDLIPKKCHFRRGPQTGPLPPSPCAHPTPLHPGQKEQKGGLGSPESGGSAEPLPRALWARPPLEDRSFTCSPVPSGISYCALQAALPVAVPTPVQMTLTLSSNKNKYVCLSSGASDSAELAPDLGGIDGAVSLGSRVSG